jgi:hypothetical protein
VLPHRGAAAAPSLPGVPPFRIDRLPGADDPDYLAETDEIVLSQAVRDQAAALSSSPVKIYHRVRNHVT